MHDPPRADFMADTAPLIAFYRITNAAVTREGALGDPGVGCGKGEALTTPGTPHHH